MDRTAQNPHPQSTANKRRMMDFAPSKPITPASQGANTATTPPTPATPVTSAKAAINARFAERANQPSQAKSSPRMVTSAREAVNTAMSGPLGSPKSAAHLHHGSIQRNMESVRTSASALLQRSAPPAPKPPRIIESKNSYDPLARVPSAANKSITRPRVSSNAVPPVVKTSLKLGNNMRPKQSPVILPAGNGTKRLSNLLATQKQRANTRPAPNPAYRGVSTVRDTQMTNRRTYSEQDFARRQALETAKHAKMADIIDAELGAPGRPAAPITVEDVKEEPQPSPREAAVAEDISRIAEATIAERVPQSLEVKRTKPGQSPAHPQPSSPNAQSPAARLVEKRIAPGANNFRADNSPTYSFSRPKNQPSPATPMAKKGKVDSRDKLSNKNRYSATEKSPFLKSVQVDKRPLSDSSIPPQPTTVNTGLTTKSERKKEVKRVKAKQQQNLPSRPTVIIPASRRSRAPLFFLVVLTVILGAIVGTATYFFFFNEF